MFFHTRSCTTCWYVSIFKELFFNCYRVFSIAGAKVRSFFILPKLFESFFKKVFFSISKSAINLPPNYPPLRQYTWLTTPSSLDCGCKDNALKHIYPNFLTSFFDLFTQILQNEWRYYLGTHAYTKREKWINAWMTHSLYRENQEKCEIIRGKSMEKCGKYAFFYWKNVGKYLFLFS